jgi:hypothetical protein
MKKIYEVEMSSTTYRTFEVVADSSEDAQNIAFAQLDEDYMISTAWKEGASIVSCDPLGDDIELDKLNRDL